MRRFFTRTGLIMTMIFFGALALRVWQLNNLPASLNRDEAALAYNAFLLKEVGKDEWGRAWPLALESFGDYKLPGYPMLLTIFFSFFGYADWVVRLPSALAGACLSIAIFFFLKCIAKQSSRLSVFGAALVAIQPVFFLLLANGF